MAFSGLEKRKHKNFLEKLYAGARANIEMLSLLKVPGTV